MNRYVHRKPAWVIPEAIPESVFLNRRTFLKGSLGVAAGGLAGSAHAQHDKDKADRKELSLDKTMNLYPAKRNPAFNHPRWSRATERVLVTEEEQPTLLFNGYAAWVASMYPDLNDRRYFM